VPIKKIIINVVFNGRKSWGLDICISTPLKNVCISKHIVRKYCENKIEHETRFLRGKPLWEKPRAPIGDLHYDERVTGNTMSYGPPWAHYLGGYQDRLLGGPLGLPDLRYTAPEGVEHKDYTGVVLD
jgi:hypothetical protein